MSSPKWNEKKRDLYTVLELLYFGTADAILMYLLVYMLAAGGSYLILKPHVGWPAIIAVNLGVYTLNQFISRAFKNDDVGIMVALGYLIVTLLPLFHFFF